MQRDLQTISNLKAIYAKEYRLRKARYIAPKQEPTKRPHLVRDIALSRRKTESRSSEGSKRRFSKERVISPSSHRTVSKCIVRNLNSIVRAEKRQIDKTRHVRQSKDKTRYVQTLRESRLEDRKRFDEKTMKRKSRKHEDAQKYKMKVGNQLCEFDTQVLFDLEDQHMKNRAANIRHRLVKDQNFLEEVRSFLLFSLSHTHDETT